MAISGGNMPSGKQQNKEKKETCEKLLAVFIANWLKSKHKTLVKKIVKKERKKRKQANSKWLGSWVILLLQNYYITSSLTDPMPQR